MLEQEKIVACIDGATLSEAVCDYAAWIARTVNAPLKLLHSVEHRTIPAVADITGALGLGASEDLLAELTEVEENRSRLLIQKGQLMLDAAKARASEAGVEHVDILQRHGSLAESLVDLEAEIRVLVIGIRGEDHESPPGPGSAGPIRRNASGTGTQLESLVRALHKPILVVNRGFSVPKKIMLAYDGSEAAIKGLHMVAGSPLFKQIPCHLVHVVDSGSGTDELLESAARELSEAGIEVTRAQLTGPIEDALSTYQAKEDIDLTVMGAFSHGRLRKFLLGSFTSNMLERTQRPLLLLR
ncbi:universal stress protein [Allohahella marinimesophila]